MCFCMMVVVVVDVECCCGACGGNFGVLHFADVVIWFEDPIRWVAAPPSADMDCAITDSVDDDMFYNWDSILRASDCQGENEPWIMYWISDGSLQMCSASEAVSWYAMVEMRKNRVTWIVLCEVRRVVVERRFWKLESEVKWGRICEDIHEGKVFVLCEKCDTNQ